jgi:hypothetical protein
MLTAAQDSDTPNPVLLLFHPEEERGSDIQAFVTTPAGLKAAEVGTTGGLPPAEVGMD